MIRRYTVWNSWFLRRVLSNCITYFFLYQNFCVLCSISRVLFSKIWHIPEISTLFCGSRLKHQKIISMSPQKSSIFSQKFSWMQLIAGRCIYFIQGFGGSEGVGVKQSPLLTLPALLLTTERAEANFRWGYPSKY